MKILNGITLTGNAALDANSLTVGSTQIIATNGAVGIGTTNPTTTLQVVGTITATTFSGPLSGNATTATTLQTARTINATSFNGSANITIDQLYRIDDRAIAPGDITTGYMKFGFGSWNNNSTSPYADFLHFRSYTDSSGGSDNLLMFAKNTIGIRLYQQAYGSTTNYSTYRDVAFTDSPTFTGTVTAPTFSGTLSGNITGNAATVTNGLYSTGAYSNPSWITGLSWSKILGTPTTLSGYGITDALSSNNASLTRINSVDEGGQINFNRPSDNTMYWALDTYGTSTAPSFRLLETTNVRLQVDAGGAFKFNGSAGSSGQVLTSQGAASTPIWSNAGTGTVTSVAMTVPSYYTVTGSPITSSGTFALSVNNQNANTVLAGPTTGAATTPTFRSLVSADIPNLGASYLPLTGGTVTGNVSIVGTFAQGNTSSATGTYSAAFGVSVLSGGSASFVEGVSNAAMSEAAHAEGKFNLAVHGGEYTITARDNVSKAVALSSTAGLTAGDTLHFYVINGAPITGLTISSIAGSTVYLNGNPNITAFWNMAVERSTVQVPVHVEGYNNFVSGYASHAEGYRTKSIGDYGAHTEGSNTTASGDSSHAEGDSTIASDQSAHAEGYQTTASQFAAHAEGQQTIASGDSSHAEGYATVASGWVAHAEGDSTAALTDRAHAEGINTMAAQGALYTITAFNDTAKTITLDSVAGITTNNVLEIKRGNDQTGPITGVTVSSIAGNVVTLNTTTTITSSWLYAIKKVTNGVGGQHAEGAYSIATGIASHAQNNYTIASGDNSHSGGLGTIAQGQNQTVIGKYNIAQGTTNSLVDTDHAFIIGNGTSGSTRSNAVSINWNGGATFAGTISAATPTASNHVALKSNVDDAIAIAWLGL